MLTSSASQKNRSKLDLCSIRCSKQTEKEVKKASTSHYSMVYFHSITKQMRRQSQLSEKHNPSDIQSAWLRVHYFKINSGPLTHRTRVFSRTWQGPCCPFISFQYYMTWGCYLLKMILQYHWLPLVLSIHQTKINLGSHTRHSFGHQSWHRCYPIGCVSVKCMIIKQE